MLHKLWKDAATVILLAQQKKPFRSPFNYKILTLKRSAESSFMPSAYVFPGGTEESSDKHLDWLDFFHSNGISEINLKHILYDTNKLPPIFRDSETKFISKQLSLRITAIRETFEEAGVLLCRKPCSNENIWGSSYSSMDLSEWRSKVQSDPSSFLEMCRSINVVPDLWGLKLWSNWLTPPPYKKRFDTCFYTFCLTEQPQTFADDKEVEKLIWQSPIELLTANNRKKLWLPIPQLYELSRILPFCMLEDLAIFAQEREHQGLERFGGIHRVQVKDGLVMPLPGDELYDNPERKSLPDTTIEDLRRQSFRKHRLELRDGKEDQVKIVASNFIPNCGHILPFTEESPA